MSSCKTSPTALFLAAVQKKFLKSFRKKFSVNFSAYFSLENLLAVVICKMMNEGGRSIIQQSQKNSHFSCQENFSTSSRCRGISSIGIIIYLPFRLTIFFSTSWNYLSALQSIAEINANHWQNYANQCQLDVWQARQNAWDSSLFFRSKRSVGS